MVYMRCYEKCEVKSTATAISVPDENVQRRKWFVVFENICQVSQFSLNTVNITEIKFLLRLIDISF